MLSKSGMKFVKLIARPDAYYLTKTD